MIVILKKSVIAVALSIIVSVMFTACGANQSGTASEASQSSNSSETSGSLTAAGSTALQPLVEKAAELFMEKNSGANIQVQGGGSGTGLKLVSEGGSEIGNSDVYAEEKLPADLANQLADHKVCVVGFATVVNPKVTVNNLTGQQLIDIFTGKITNWKDVGGSDMKIVILNRPSSSGTRATFKKYALKGSDEAEGKALTEDSSGTILKTIADTEGSISYLAFSYVNSTVKALKYDNVEPKAENVKNGSYPIWSYEHMYTKGEASGAVKAFIDYMTGNEFKTSISEMGYIPISEMTVSR